jgi:hypothetical protein
MLKAKADMRERAAQEPRPQPLGADILDGIDFDDLTPEEVEARDRKAAKARRKQKPADDLTARAAREWRAERDRREPLDRLDGKPDDDEGDEAVSAPRGASKAERLPIKDFTAFSPDHSYIYKPDGEVWSAAAVNARVLKIEVSTRTGKKKLSASTWLDRNDAVEQRTWAPGHPQIIEDKLILAGGFFAKKGARVFNLYKPPMIIHPINDDISFWQSHLYELWPDQAEHIEKWFAHRVQRPGEKINHGLLLTGDQGIGKDAVIEPLKRAVGVWNVKEISPQAILGNFNEYLQSVVLRISEIKDLGDIDRFTFYEATKTLMVAPPDTLRCNPKYVRPFSVLNVTGPIMTSNYKVSGLYLPADDRRHLVAWSTKKRIDYDAAYWAKYWGRLDASGDAAVAKHLRELDLSDFNPKAPPEQTQAFWEIVDSLRTAEGGDMANVLDALGNPEILTLPNIVAKAKYLTFSHFAEFLEDPKNRRKTSMELEDNGYLRLNNPHDQRGRWSFHGGHRINVYRRKDISDREGFDAVKKAGGG